MPERWPLAFVIAVLAVVSAVFPHTHFQGSYDFVYVALYNNQVTARIVIG